MRDFKGRDPYMDYRNSVPFADLAGFISQQQKITDEMPTKSLQEYLMKKKFSTMINLRRLEYRSRVESFKNGRI